MPTTYTVIGQTTSELGGSATIYVQRSGDLPAETIYGRTTETSGSTNVGDFTALTNTPIVFGAGVTEVGVNVAIAEDRVLEPNETFGFAAMRNTGDPIGSALATGTFTIQNDDNTYTMTLNASDVNENAGTLTVTITRTGPLQDEQMLLRTQANLGSANNGDYTELNDLRVRFLTGETVKTVNIAILNDLTTEGVESFTLDLRHNSTSPGTEPVLASTAFRILDDDAVPAATAYRASPVTVNEAAGTATFTVFRTGDFPVETVYLRTTDAEGSTNSGDLTALNGQPMTWALGEEYKTFTVSITDDASIEGSETFGVLVQRGASDPDTTYLTRSTLTITDNDTPFTYTISPTGPFSEESGTVTFTVTRSGTVPLVAETLRATTLETEGSTNSGDYTALVDTAVSFGSGATTATFTLPILNDGVQESDETYAVLCIKRTNDGASLPIAA